jgi:beta-lactamase class A
MPDSDSSRSSGFGAAGRRHRARPARHRRLAVWVTSGALAALIAVLAWVGLRGSPDRSSAEVAGSITPPAASDPTTAAAGARSPTATARPATTPPAVSYSTKSHSSAAARAATRVRAAETALDRLVQRAPPGGVSVAAEDLTTGVSFHAGASRGMTSASVAKLEILETLLLHAHGPLTGAVADTATGMIENSNNDDADTCFADLGGSSAYVAAKPELGLTSATVLDQGVYWGLDTTSGADQVTLLRDLVSSASPLAASARKYALHLLGDVEADQRWGVPVIADSGTSYAVKNGWLGVSSDNGRWAVNSDALVTYHGHHLAVSIMTQHGPDEESGIDEVDALARSVATVVDPAE